MKTLSRADQHAQCMREVKATLLVVAICAFWHIGTAFALNGNGKILLGMPMWFTVSVFGTCILGIAGVIVLAKFIFIDFEYDKEIDDVAAVVSCELGDPEEIQQSKGFKETKDSKKPTFSHDVMAGE